MIENCPILIKCGKINFKVSSRGNFENLEMELIGVEDFRYYTIGLHSKHFVSIR